MRTRFLSIPTVLSICRSEGGCEKAFSQRDIGGGGLRFVAYRRRQGEFIVLNALYKPGSFVGCQESITRIAVVHISRQLPFIFTILAFRKPPKRNYMHYKSYLPSLSAINSSQVCFFIGSNLQNVLTSPNTRIVWVLVSTTTRSGTILPPVVAACPNALFRVVILHQSAACSQLPSSWTLHF